MATQGNADRRCAAANWSWAKKPQATDWKYVATRSPSPCKRVRRKAIRRPRRSAQADYQAQVQAKVQSLQTEAQTLRCCRRRPGRRQGQAPMRPNRRWPTRRMSTPATLVKTKDEHDHAPSGYVSARSSPILCNRTAVFANDEQAENLTNKEARCSPSWCSSLHGTVRCSRPRQDPR